MSQPKWREVPQFALILFFTYFVVVFVGLLVQR